MTDRSPLDELKALLPRILEEGRSGFVRDPALWTAGLCGGAALLCAAFGRKKLALTLAELAPAFLLVGVMTRDDAPAASAGPLVKAEDIVH